ncbi:MAG: 7-cyano-7-deazaguanine synthase QueC [Muribaculaceae bacterium]|nr:7-cyano-7-deazaguanine synthase QueC [Muribaculaceae bacterium]MBP5315991.1 7-cyano-7-deazaguanine synthase QueC [Muribaculaceae bacterium]MBR4721997.1 7-cyano-7-deazaguanine synthase QueC [Muribaculaceae bacterium]
MVKDSLIILSGGMDSVTLLHEYADRIALAVTFDYKSTQNERERRCAVSNCQRLGIPHIIIDAEFIHRHFESVLLKTADDIPEGSYSEGNMKSTVVPFRNGVMLSIACGIADSRGLRHVMIANHGGDHFVYPDCRPEFIDAMSEAMKAGTDGNVDILAPYTLLSKTDIARRGVSIGVDYADTYSCYKGGENHCGRCATCIERRQALAGAGISDPTIYEN